MRDRDDPRDDDQAPQQAASAEPAVQQQGARNPDAELDDLRAERVLERVLEREQEVGVLEDARAVGLHAGARGYEDVLRQLALQGRAVLVRPKRDGRIVPRARPRKTFPRSRSPSSRGPRDECSPRKDASSSLGISRTGIVRPPTIEARAKPSAAGRRRRHLALSARGDECFGLLFRRERREDEVVGENL